MKKRPVFIVAACLLSALPIIRGGSAAHNKETLAEPALGGSGGNQSVIVAFGDSLTAGVATGKSYPEDLQDLLERRGYPYRVDNQGVSGDTTTDGLARIDNVLAEHPALVILEFGGNDGLRGVPVESINQNLEAMINQLRQANIPLVLLGITLPPNYGSDYVQSFTAMYPALAKKYNLKFVPFLLLHVYQHSELMQSDGVHPSAAGNKIVAQDVFNLIQPLLRKARKTVAVGSAPPEGSVSSFAAWRRASAPFALLSKPAGNTRAK